MINKPTYFKLIASFVTIVLITCAFIPQAYAGNTGKFTGKVEDSQTGEAIAGATVAEENGSWGAATDLDGEFVILNIPPGIYNVSISYVGYHTITIEDLQINIDLTTQQDIELTPTAVLLKEAKVVYEKPPVELGTSSSGDRYDKQKLENLKVENIGDLVKTSSGFKIDNEGFMHIRGSRSGDVAIVVGGVDFRDPLVNTQTNINLSGDGIEEVNILTGGFSAEYGRVMGGIIQVTTAEGSPRNYSGRLEVQTDRLVETYSFDTDRVDLALGGPVPGSKDLLGKPLTFYLTGLTQLTNTPYGFEINRNANDYLGIGIDLPERQVNSYQSTLNLAYPVTDTKKLSLYMTSAYRLWDIYPNGEGGISGNYGYAYKYNLDSRPFAKNTNYSGILTYTDQLSASTFYEVKLITYRTRSQVKIRGVTPGDITLLEDVEDDPFIASDINGSGILDPDEYQDSDGNGFMDGYVDANANSIYDGGGEGYEDLNRNGRWDRGEDWIDLNGNSIYDSAEPWIDVVNPLTGENNLGVFDTWDTYSDVNGNGKWDPAEPQLPEHDWNGNGRWDGERFNDANGNGVYDAFEPWTDVNGNFLWDEGEPYVDVNANGKFDYGEGYDDKNVNGKIDTRDLWQRNVNDPDQFEPFVDGDYWWDTGEPFIDEPDPITGQYNGSWDPGEIFYDLPSSVNFQTGAGVFFIGTEFGGSMTLNGRYDGPNTAFDEYELFTRRADWNFHSDPSRPVLYNFDPEVRGKDWPSDIYTWVPGKSTWINRTIHDTDLPEFNFRNFQLDSDQEAWTDYNGNGEWDNSDSFINPGLYDPTSYWQERSSTEYTVKFDLQSQVSKFHEMKGGAELKLRELEMQSLEQPDEPYTGEAVLPADSPWPDRGGVRDFYSYKPWEGAVYIQDKMEFEGLIVNAGVRGDFIIQDQKVIDEYEQRVLADEPGAIVANRSTWRISPRLGISHPITEQSKLYFNYGHFYQAPQFQYFYRSATANFDANSTIGNPNLEYEKTVQYELGVNTQISEYVVIDVSGYYKDQYDLISTSDERWKNLTLDRYVNLDYGRMRGFEFSIEKRPSHHYAMTFNYDFSYAYGKASDQHANRDARLSNVPYNWDEHPLNWDETHKINAYFTLHYGENERPNLLGFTMPDDWVMTLQWEFGSGLPYTPSKYLTGVDNSNLILPNSARLPWHEVTTLKFDKYYTVSSTRNSRAFFGFTVNNLFNKRNVVAVYNETGSPVESIHPINPLYNPGANDADYDANPRNYSAGRNILFRVGMTF